MTEQQHETQEQRMERGEKVATFDDLNALGPEDLLSVAGDCLVEPADPDACVACKAFVLYLAREDADPETPKLDDLVAEEPVFTPPAEESIVPVAQQFADKVRELESLVAEMLEGPPIPPPNVSLEDLAALMLGAEMWSKMIDAQGLTLADSQQAIKMKVDQTVARMRRINQ